MKKLYVKILLGVLVLFNACSPVVQKNLIQSYPSLQTIEEVKVYELNQEAPQGELLGTIRVGDSGFSTNCGYEVVLGMAKNEARLIGGNAIKIVEHKKPDFVSSCHRIVVKVLKIDPNAKPIQKQENKIEEKKNEVRVKTTKNDTIKKSFPKQEDNLQVIKNEGDGYYNPQITPQTLTYEKVRFSVIGGYSYRTAPLPDNLPQVAQDYYNELKSGYCFGGDIHFFVSENVGLGLKYSLHGSKNDFRSGYISDDVSIQSFGFSLMQKLPLNTKTDAFLLNLSLDYVSYKDNAVAAYVPATITGNTMGLGGGITFDHKLSNALGFCIGVSYSIGSISEFELKSGGKTTTIKAQSKDEYENLSRVEVTLGLRF